MSRYIVSELNPSFIKPDLQVITPNNAIAHHIRQVVNSQIKISHYSLETLTQNIVRRRGTRIASTLFSRRLLQNAVTDVMTTKNVEGTAKAFLATIKDLFRSGVDLKVLQQNADSRIQQLGNLAIAYEQQLRQRKCIDAAQLYWRGSTDVAYQKPYLFYGYFAPAKDELAVINAIAGQDSILVLPTNDLYPQNQHNVEWLTSQGWERFLRNEEQGARSKERGSNESYGINQLLQQCFQGENSLPDGASLNVFPNLEEEVRGVLTQV